MTRDPNGEQPRLGTVAAHAGNEVIPSLTRPLTSPIYQTAAYAYPDLAAVDAVYEGKAEGYIYGRYGVPNHTVLEHALAQLEDGAEAVATSSGMSAITGLLFSLLSSGDRIVVSDQVYAGTRNLLDQDLARFGVEVVYVDCLNLPAVQEALAEPTRALYVDTITNPTLMVHDLASLGGLARAAGALFIVDNTFATPYHCRPLDHGADLVVHSTTKFLAGHHDVTGGAVVEREDLVEATWRQAIRFGGIGGPFDAWLVLRGLKTLAVRMAQSSANALALAEAVRRHPALYHVGYPGLPEHPQHRVASHLLEHGFGSMLTLDLRGGRAAVEAMVERLELIAFAETLGGLTTTVVHPASTSHRGYSAAARQRLGITDGLIRFSIGIEDPADLIAEVTAALDAVL